MDVIAGKYRPLRMLGNGGYGRVFLVEHVDLGVRYALKVLSRTLSEDGRFIDRFKREAEILLRFSHPGSVQLRDFGRTDEGRYYMAMDFCEGVPLNTVLLNHGAFSVPDALDMMEQILNVLEAAHGHGIFHRDIKPDNVMVLTDNEHNRQIKILDFGIAKLREEVLSSSDTVEGASIGTPQYMSPEQAAGETVLDHRVDIYSSGVLFYEVLSGEVPFKGETIIQTLLMHLTRPPRPFDPLLGIPSYVEQIVFKAMHKDRKLRYQSAHEFLEAVQAARRCLDEEKQKTVAEKKANKPETKAATPEPPVEPVEQTSILCLDDNEMILNILKHILEKEGYKVFTATDCSAVHGYLFGHNVPLLICDVNMPGLPGTRVCQMLKTTLKDLKILLFSNIAERDLEKAAQECKADGYIYKNTMPREWIEKVKEVLQK
jgi:eukaryotic-like serine/threonine-protein kinase